MGVAAIQMAGHAMTAEQFQAPIRADRFWRRLFDSPTNSIVTILVGLAILYILIKVVRWAVLDAVFLADLPAQCSAAAGACWATVYHHARVVFFGLYPREEHWRAGHRDAKRALDHPETLQLPGEPSGVAVFDFSRKPEPASVAPAKSMKEAR